VNTFGFRVDTEDDRRSGGSGAWIDCVEDLSRYRITSGPVNSMVGPTGCPGEENDEGVGFWL
jgi:hypothetical protein